MDHLDRSVAILHFLFQKLFRPVLTFGSFYLIMLFGFDLGEKQD
jgi:hypothetical protein